MNNLKNDNYNTPTKKNISMETNNITNSLQKVSN